MVSNFAVFIEELVFFMGSLEFGRFFSVFSVEVKVLRFWVFILVYFWFSLFFRKGVILGR